MAYLPPGVFGFALSKRTLSDDVAVRVLALKNLRS